MMKTIICANGNPEDGSMVNRALVDADKALIIAADGGARIAWYFGMRPDIVIGDMDSLLAHEITKLEDEGAEILRYPPEKDQTDLELALMHAVEKGATYIRVLGAIGGRFDQMLANIYLLALPELKGVDVEIVAGKQRMSVLRAGDHFIDGDQGDTLSLIPLDGNVKGISTYALKYPLRNESLTFGPARGISNVMLEDRVQISFKSGILLCVHTQGRA